MADITTNDLPPNEPGRPPAPVWLPVTNISQWVERFSVMAAILCTRFPHKAPELLTYQAAIVRAECNYEGTQWVSYDCRYCREALARKDLNWSVLDPRLYSEAFTGRAKNIQRCSFCLQDDHKKNTCPRNPHRPLLGWLPPHGRMANSIRHPTDGSSAVSNYNIPRDLKAFQRGQVYQAAMLQIPSQLLRLQWTTPSAPMPQLPTYRLQLLPSTQRPTGCPWTSIQPLPLLTDPIISLLLSLTHNVAVQSCCYQSMICVFIHILCNNGKVYLIEVIRYDWGEWVLGMHNITVNFSTFRCDGLLWPL